MTDVLEPLALDLDVAVERPSVASGAPTAAIGLATLSACAGVIHAALTPSHIGEWALEGVGFALAAWLQLGVAAVLIRRRSVVALQVAVISNLAFIATWLISRTSGFPFGPHAGQAERSSFVDGVTVAIEAALVLGALAAVMRPARRHRSSGWRRGIVPVVAVVAATAALLSPSARDHAHDAHSEHDHVVTDDGGFSLLHNGQHAHAEPYKLDPASQRALDAQLAITRQVANLYPTVKAAEAAGYTRAGPYVPGLGAHWVLLNASGLNFDGVLDEDDLWHPTSLQFDGVLPSSKLAGFMYVSASTTEPVGFVGRNDVWHFHSSLCTTFANGHLEFPFGADHQATAAQCAKVGGHIWRQTVWMLHVWSVPGYQSRDGVFAENNRKLDCSDGTYYVLPADEWATHLKDVCVADAS